MLKIGLSKSTIRSVVIALFLIVITGCGHKEPESIEPKSCTELEPGTAYCKIEHREYQVYVPASYTGETPVPLVIDLHGAGGTAQDERDISPWTLLVETQGFIIAYPQGNLNLWNAHSFGCGMERPNLPDDVSFIESVVATIRAGANIDPARIIVTGISNGGAMAHTMACESADIFTAAVPMDYPLSGDGGLDDIIDYCAPARPIPVIHFHGLLDDTLSYVGEGNCLDARDSHWAWSVIQNCSSELKTTQIAYNTVCETYDGCDGGVSVTLCTVSNGGHAVTLLGT